ncbi:MAG: hypothetical protein JSV33_07105 [bacterium]|nr:MAG: hypothetical protein JSV33_07105 [bacterium]
MSAKKISVFTLISLITVGILLIGCDDDSSYDQRTVVYVSNINDGAPFISDVLDQGDSLWTEDYTAYNTNDDFIQEDWITVEFHNRPYSSIVDVGSSSLGDFLLTSYDVQFVRYDGGPTPVRPFSGQTSILVPCNQRVEAVILLVPYNDKQIPPLSAIAYVWDVEILAYAVITFHGHEVQSEREIDFTAQLTVNFGDPIITDEND